jgi:hypothetical protein
VNQLACCRNSSWVFERDLGSAGGFEYSLGKCGGCATPWMGVFSVASGVSGHEPVTPDDVRAIHAITDNRELKAFMRNWGDENL